MAHDRHEGRIAHTYDASSMRSAGFFMLVTLLAMAVGIGAAIAT